MKSTVAIILMWALPCLCTFAQKATISEKKVKMKTYMFSDPNPVPDMEKNYPYFRFDGFTNKSIEKDWNMVIMENDYIKVYIATEIGGKIWGAIEKSTGGEFLYFNDVVKFRDVAHRGPWTSGGLEYNFGIMSHVSTCSTPQDYVLTENPDGSVSCIIGAMDLHTQTKWNVEVLLPEDKAFVKTKASWFNTNNIPVSFYHYMNAAAKTAGNLEFIYPGSHHIGHGGRVGDWPVDKGREISFYENNNFGSYKSYHVLNSYSDYMGGYWHDDNFGFGHLVDYADLPGKKLWLWGLSMEGMIWEDLLTDTKGQYIEYQSGKSFNQAMTTSSLTPFKHSEFIPYDSDITTELWFPIKETGGMVAASEYGVLNVVKGDSNIKLILSALQKLDTKLVVQSGDHVVKEYEIQLDPLELFTSEMEMDISADFIIELGDELLFYSSKRADLIVDRPLYPNEEYDWESAVGLFTRGFELEKQQSYITGGYANMKAHELYLKSLAIDPAYAPALNRLALSYYRMVDDAKALDHVRKSLAINTYDPEANYIFGLINKRLNKNANAKSGFSIAAQSPQYRAAAYTELALMYLQEKMFKKAIMNATNALAFNQYNTTAIKVLALAYRQQENEVMLFEMLDKLYDFDKTSTFHKYMTIQSNQGELSELDQLITNELPYESFLQLAIDFYNFGFPEESIAVLKSAPEYAIVFLWLAYLDEENQQEWLDKGLMATADFVFPYRDETLKVLEQLMKVEDSWKLKYYAALIYWKRGRMDVAEKLFEQCNSDPDYVPFYLTKATFFNQDVVKKKAALEKAKILAADDWRVNLALTEQHLLDKEYAMAAELASKTFKKYPERSVLGMNYAIALLNLGEYKKCVSFLEAFQLIPFEGAVMGRNVYREACIREALAAFEKKKYKSAIEYAEKALVWPLNLGSGKPYHSDERLENYLIAYCYRQLGKNVDANSYYNKVMDPGNPGNSIGSPILYLQILVLNESNREDEAEKLLREALISYPENEYVLWVKAVMVNGISGSHTDELVLVEKEKAEINNDFLLLHALLSVNH
jgi:tetratricopeptide (TPR) repeat protein